MVRIVGIEPPPGAIIRAAMLDELVQLPESDTGNAEALEMLYGNRFRYDHSRKRWMVWNGLAWVADSDGEAERAAIDTARWRGTAAVLKSVQEQRKIGWWDTERIAATREGESVHGIKATLDVAKNLHPLTTLAAHYDRD